MLWIGERTRQLDGAHVAFLRRRRQPDRLQDRPDHDARRGASRSASARPRPDPRPADAHQPHGRRHASPRCCRRCSGGARRRPPRRVGVRPDARQHVHRVRAGARPATSTTCWPRSPASSPPTAPRHLARWRARRADRRRRHRVPRRGRGDPRRRPRRPATRRCATPASTAASRSTWPSGWPSCCVAETANRAIGNAARRFLSCSIRNVARVGFLTERSAFPTPPVEMPAATSPGGPDAAARDRLRARSSRHRQVRASARRATSPASSTRTSSASSA